MFCTHAYTHTHTHTQELSEQGALLTLCALPLAGAVCMHPDDEFEHETMNGADKSHPTEGPADQALPVSAPSAGFLGLASPPSPPLVSLLQEAVEALQRRALNADLATQPQPYRCVCVCMHVCVHVCVWCCEKRWKCCSSER